LVQEEARIMSKPEFSEEDLIDKFNAAATELHEMEIRSDPYVHSVPSKYRILVDTLCLKFSLATSLAQKDAAKEKLAACLANAIINSVETNKLCYLCQPNEKSGINKMADALFSAGADHLPGDFPSRLNSLAFSILEKGTSVYSRVKTIHDIAMQAENFLKMQPKMSAVVPDGVVVPVPIMQRPKPLQ
jgi:hypothetical protein